MKSLVLTLLLAAAALAQVPAKSNVGSVTIEVADISLPVPYGPAETKAMISACSTDEVTAMTFSVYYNKPLGFVAQLGSISKTATGYCGTIVAPVERKLITFVTVDRTSTTQIAAPAVPDTGTASAHRR